MTEIIGQGKEDILVIDDRPENLRLLSVMLNRQGYEVRKAINGKLGLQAALTVPPDIILYRFQEFFNREWRRMIREQSPLAVILCDIDYFKNYNDHFGHQAGDNCLRKVAQAISDVVQRAADLVARYGGEEFVVILPNIEESGALKVAETIRQNVEKLQLEHSQSSISNFVTLSLGVACTIPNENNSPELLLATADKALYQAKQQGRNQAVLISI